MAGSKLNKRVKASTILEVIVSMVVIVLVFGIAMMIFANVTRTSLSVKKTKALAILNHVMSIAEMNQQNITQTISVDDFRIEQEVKPYGENANLIDIHLTAYDQNQQKVAELEKILY